MILADSSVWIDHFRGSDLPHVSILRDAIRGGSVLVADLVLMEILQGVSDDNRARRIRRDMLQLPLRTIAAGAVPLKAADNYRSLRRLGITPRNAIDTLIATYCIEQDIELLHNDRDFDYFERHLGLRVVSLPALER